MGDSSGTDPIARATTSAHSHISQPPQGFHTFDASGKKKGGEKRAGNLNNRLVISAKKSTWEYKSHYEWLLRRSVLSL
ncbi:hypothetical protein Y032_0201g1717 [Ancylostoma ceylanicum]|uniref:Uncharacterized protein n=1 Tax=Ancylostoma ceylanicum TaxID=53326 RepID=A0A016SNA8_9BILA|nr:hypothetical protein Y032_0201g1717 [Ancylostoma ceylanicum]